MLIPAAERGAALAGMDLGEEGERMAERAAASGCVHSGLFDASLRRMLELGWSADAGSTASTLSNGELWLCHPHLFALPCVVQYGLVVVLPADRLSFAKLLCVERSEAHRDPNPGRLV